MVGTVSRIGEVDLYTGQNSLFITLSSSTSQTSDFDQLSHQFSALRSKAIPSYYSIMGFLAAYWGLGAMMILMSLMIGFYAYMTRNFKYWAKRGVMEIPPTPFIGNFANCLLFKKSPALFVKDLYEQSKGYPYMGFYIFDRPFFLVRDPELVKHVLVKDFHVFNNRFASANVNDRLGYASLFMIKDSTWKMLRTKLTPFFTSGKLRKMFDLMRFTAEDLDKYLQRETSDSGKVLNMKDLCANYTTDLVARYAFGINANAIHDPTSPMREIRKAIFKPQITRGLELLIVFFAPHLTKITGAKFFGKEASEFFRSTVWGVAKERIKAGEKRNDAIDFLLDLRKKHKDDENFKGLFSFDDDDLVAQIVGFFTAGFETSSTTMCFSLYELALNMDVQKKLRQEILDTLEEADGQISYDVIMNLPYLDMVVSEALRKYPPLAFLDRVANADYKVPNSDLVLQKGTPVYIPMYGIHYDPEYFPDPEKFDPERFNEENKRKRPGYTYFPFGEGPHYCIGLRLGLLQTKLGLVTILSKYEVTTCEKTAVPVPMNPKSLGVGAKGGVFLNIQRVPV